MRHRDQRAVEIGEAMDFREGGAEIFRANAERDDRSTT
jgi:hypothetical protein